MKNILVKVFTGLILAAFVLSLIAIANAQKKASGLNVPVTYYKLPNGLRVVLSPEKSAPLVTVAIYYGIGFRIEPKDRTGFAHLFEHLMFQGSRNMGKMAKRGSKEYYAMGLLEEILISGEDSRLYQELVKNKKYTNGIRGGINGYLGNMFNYNGPMLFMVDLIHDERFTPQEILGATDTIVADIQAKGVTQAEIDRAIVKLRSGLYDTMQQFGGVGRADLLACFALFDDNPQAINQIEDNFRRVTPKDIQETAKEYLRKTNRTVVIINPEKAAAKSAE
jgi:predicted Zn-dependent peptidase